MNDLRQRISERLGGREFRGMIPAAEAQQLAHEAEVEVPRLMTMLLPLAAEYARPLISNYKVGAVSRGLSGNLYYGTNLEFAGEALSFTLHAEQSSVANAWMHGETGIDLLAVTAAPCGFCRQFLYELSHADQLVMTLPSETLPLTSLLPAAFGPRDLGIEGGLLHPQQHDLVIDEHDELALAALAAAKMSYAPYSKSYAGVAVNTRHGALATGAYAENAAFNPSLSPLEAALSQLNLAGENLDEICEAVLVRVDGTHDSATRTVLGSVTGASLRVVQARNSG